MDRKDEKAEQREVLPSFLSSLPLKGKDLNLKVFRKSGVEVTGPIFFGGCEQYHPQPQKKLIFSHVASATRKRSVTNVWENLFSDVKANAKAIPPRKPFRLVRKRVSFVYNCSHRARGALVVAGPPTFKRFKPDLGISKSKIKGETIREVLCGIPVDPSLKGNRRYLELERKRDMMERNRSLLPPEKRAAHIHFPKEFIFVTVIGPPLPVSMTVQQLVKDEKEDREEDSKEPDKKLIEEKGELMDSGNAVDGLEQYGMPEELENGEASFEESFNSMG